MSRMSWKLFRIRLRIRLWVIGNREIRYWVIGNGYWVMGNGLWVNQVMGTGLLVIG